MHAGAPSSPWGVALVVGLGAFTLWELAGLGLMTPQAGLVACTALLLGYLAVEIRRLHRASPRLWLMNPAVLCSVVTFIVGFGISNALYFFPEEVLLSLYLTPDVTSWMVRLMLLVLVGAIAMWLGYWSRSAMALSAWLAGRRWLDRLLKREFTPRPGVLATLALASLGSRLTEIGLGVYGYSADYDRLIELASIRQYLSYVDGLGRVALTVAALQYYSPGLDVRARYWFAGLLAYEILFGFLSGFKNEVAMPFVIVGLCKYLRQGVVPWRWIALFAVSLAIAFAVIEPFRAARFGQSSFQGTSVTSIAGTMLAATVTDSMEPADAQEFEAGLLFLKRISMTHIASLGIEFADTKELPAGSPGFLRDIFLAPLYAIVPRVLWESKETTRHGLWYWNEVMGLDSWEVKTAVGMSPFTYLYFAGGILGVALGFFALGIVQRAWADRFLAFGTSGAIIVFLLGLRVLVIPDSVYYTIVVDLVRIVPASLVLQHLVFRR